MLPRHVAAALLIVLATAGCKRSEEAPAENGPPAEPQPQPAEKAPTFKLSGLTPAGTKLEFTRSRKLSDATMSMEIEGQPLEGSLSIDETDTEKVEFRSADERVIELGSAIKVMAMNIPGVAAEDQEEANPLNGQTLTATRAGGEWRYRTETTLSPEQNAELAKRREIDGGAAAIYPDRAVEIGETWEPDLAAIGQLLGGSIDVIEGEASFRLVEIAEHQGQRCARLAVSLRARGEVADDKAPVAVTIEFAGEVLRSLELFQDLDVDLAGTMLMEGGAGKMRAEGPFALRISAE